MVNSGLLIRATWYRKLWALPAVEEVGGEAPDGRDAQPALLIGRHYITERDSAPVQNNGIV